MATRKLYLEQSTLRVQAIVTAAVSEGERKAVRLNRTVFHAQGGGQRPDKGTIAGKPVLDVRHAADGEVDHFVADLNGITVGDTVEAIVDPVTRDLHSRLHSAGHLVADAARDIEATLAAKSGHHWPGEARVEFEGRLQDIEAFRARLQCRVDDLVAADVPIIIVGDPSLSRAIKIGHNAPVGCGGTHVSSASALISIHIRKVQQKKDVVRVSYGVTGES